jgi:hypothetical protein
MSTSTKMLTIGLETEAIHKRIYEILSVLQAFAVNLLLQSQT